MLLKWICFAVFCLIGNFCFVQSADSIPKEILLRNTASVYPVYPFSANSLRMVFLSGDINQPENPLPQLILPAYELGVFCKFENYLNYRKKLPLNFGTD